MLYIGYFFIQKVQYVRILVENFHSFTKIINIMWRNNDFDFLISVYWVTKYV